MPGGGGCRACSRNAPAPEETAGAAGTHWVLPRGRAGVRRTAPRCPERGVERAEPDEQREEPDRHAEDRHEPDDEEDEPAEGRRAQEAARPRAWAEEPAAEQDGHGDGGQV